MLREIAAGVVIGVGVFALLVGCMGGGLSPLVRCKLEALKVLPEDPGMVSVYDGIDLVERLNACHRAEADGGE
jgi:hypothetical protein